ncbi:hypothetical protein Q5752_003741 [Cryptotrichosporon argae]
MSAPKVILHHLNASRSDRIAWLLEELGVEYEIKAYMRLPTRQAPPELKKVAPLGKAPIVQLGDRTIFESGAIVSALLAAFPHPSLEDTPSGDTEFWAHWAEGSFMSHIQGATTVAATTQGFAAGKLGVEVSEEGGKAVLEYGKWYENVYFRSNVQAQLDLVESWLASHPTGFFSGTDKPGAGDVLMFTPLNGFTHGPRAQSGLIVGPQTRTWVERVRARPANQRAHERLHKAEEAAKAKM